MDHAARAKKALEGLIYSPRSNGAATDADAGVGATAGGAAADAALFSPLHELQVCLTTRGTVTPCNSMCTGGNFLSC